MKLTRPVRRAMPETIIALIDVVFFLLVFFMLIGRMDATSPFEVLPPITTTGTDMPAGGATVSIGATGFLALDGTEQSEQALLQSLKALLIKTPNLLVRINAHRDAIMADLLPLIAQFESVGAHDIVLVVTPEGP